MSPPSDQDNRFRRMDRMRARMPVRPAATLEVVLPAEWVAPSIARDYVRQWLTDHRWSPAHLDDLVLAVSEAVSNSVEHGYGIAAEATHSNPTAPSGTVEIRGEVITDADGARCVEFAIRDHGRWISRSGIRTDRGHGMTIMRACTDELTIDNRPDGTTVVLRSRPLPRPPRTPR